MTGKRKRHGSTAVFVLWTVPARKTAFRLSGSAAGSYSIRSFPTSISPGALTVAARPSSRSELARTVHPRTRPRVDRVIESWCADTLQIFDFWPAFNGSSVQHRTRFVYYPPHPDRFRLERDAEHLHALGARATAEPLTEVTTKIGGL